MTSIPALSATASSASSRATERVASARRRASRSCGRLVGDGDVGLERDPAPLERLDQAGDELTRAALDERAGRLDLRGVDERVGGGGAEPGLDLLLDLLADPLLDVGAQLRERVELAARAGEVVVERRQDLLLHVLERHLDRACLALAERVLDLLRLACGHADERLLDLFDDAARAELDRVVALRLAAVGDEVDDERVARLRGTLDRRELRDREAERLDLLVDELGGHLDVRRADLEAFQSATSTFGWTSTVAVKLNGSVASEGSS